MPHRACRAYLKFKNKTNKKTLHVTHIKKNREKIDNRLKKIPLVCIQKEPNGISNTENKTCKTEKQNVVKWTHK